MPDHKVLTTFTLVKFPLSFAAFTKVSVGVYTRKMFTLVKSIWYLSKLCKSKHGISVKYIKDMGLGRKSRRLDSSRLESLQLILVKVDSTY